MSMFLARDSKLLGPTAAALVLIAFWLGMVASVRDASQTLDEGAHVTAGYAYWRFNDYRLDPENGNLPNRVVALPLLFGNYRFPAIDSETWRNSDKWGLSWQWFYELRNDAD